MTAHRLLATCIALAAAWPHAAHADARDDAALAALAARAPLAVSGDGAWRLHVDAHDVLHRASLADPAHETVTPLPPGVQAIAASGDGRRLVIATNRACVGRVDFTADGAGSVTWRPIETSNGTPMRAAAAPWIAQMPADCGAHEPAPAVAISSDGRWIATPEVVVDASTNQVVASLPADGQRTLRLAFVDHDTRLLVVRAAVANGVEAGVWDLASKTLVNAVDVPQAAWLQVDVSAATGTLFHVHGGDTDAPTQVLQLAPGTCGAAPRLRARTQGGAGKSLVVDPYGRWFAWLQPVAPPPFEDPPLDPHGVRLPLGPQPAPGPTSRIVVIDMASGHEIASAPSRFVLGGLTALPDGSGLLALGTRAVDPRTGEPTIAADADELVRIDLSQALATLPRDAARPYTTGYCREPGEAPGARAMARLAHPLAPAWTHDLAADAAGTPAAEASTCTYAATTPVPFRTPDGGLWFDVGAQVVRLDPRTGEVVKTLPTPRGKNVCSVVAPTGAGFFNATGDTLTWRPLAAATDKTRRRVIEHRPGWAATLAPARDDVVRVLWTPVGATGQPGINVVDYDANGKRVATFDVGAGSQTSVDDVLAPTTAAAPPCRDARGLPVAIGYDWRAGPFGTQRGAVCGPLPGVPRLVWWSGTTIAPRPQGELAVPVIGPASDGAIGVVETEGQLRVVNLALQREIAQIPLDDVASGRAWVLANQRLVLVQSASADGHARVRAYALP